MLSDPVTPTQITRGQRLWLYALVTLIALFLVVPCLLVIPMSFSGGTYLEFPPKSLSLRWYQAVLGSPEWRQATLTSLNSAGPTTVIATVLGTAAAWGIHQRSTVFSQGLRGLFMLPMLVPLILVAIGLFFLFSRLGLNGTLTGLVLAHTMLAIPFVVIAVGNGLSSYDMSQHMVAQSLGANGRSLPSSPRSTRWWWACSSPAAATKRWPAGCFPTSAIRLIRRWPRFPRSWSEWW